MEDGLLKLLANPTNQAILTHLAIEPLYTRRIAELVGLSEEETSRRLRAFERAGILTAEWANVGRTVRLYRLATASMDIHVTPHGIRIHGALAPPAPLPAAPAPPAARPLLGRAGELHALTQLLRARRRVCVHGMGGIGKTSLAASLAAAWDAPVAWRSASPSESPALLLHRLTACFRPHAGAAPPLDDDVGLASWISRAATSTGALVVLDRAEAASDDVLALLAAIAERAPDACFLVVARAFPSGLPRTFAPFELGGLDRAASLELLAPAGLAPDAADALVRAVAGHPLCLVLAASHAREHGEAAPAKILEASGVRAFLLEDLLAKLPDAERDALLRWSVLEVPFTEDEAVELGPPRAHDLLLRTAARGLVARAPEGWQVHDLVRSTLAPAAGPAAHKAAARVLGGSPDPARGLLALRHTLLSGDVSGAGASVLAECTERTRRFGEHGLAVPYGRLLDELEPRLRSPRQRAAALLERAHLTEHQVDAHSHIERARPFIGTRGPLAARLLLEEAELARRSGDGALCMRLAQSCADEASNALRLRADALLLRAAVAEEADTALASSAYTSAIEAAEMSDDPRLLALAYAGAARTNSGPGREALAEEALRLAKLTGHVRGEAMAHMTLTDPYLDPASSAEDALVALDHAQETLAIARRLEDPWMRACSLADVGIFSVRVGDHATALRVGEEGMTTAAGVGSAFLVAACASSVAHALVAQGEPLRARDILVDAMDAYEAKTHGAPYAYAIVWLARAHVEAACGHAEAAAEAREKAQALWPH